MPSAISVPLHARAHDVTRIRERSRASRAEYLRPVDAAHGAAPDLTPNGFGSGRELVAAFRAVVGEAESGALSCM